MHPEAKSDPLTGAIIGAAITVHKALGPGLLESAYRICLARELAAQQIPFQPEVPVPLEYRGERIDAVYRLDLLVDNLVIVELKAVDALAPIHEAQLLTYLRLTKKRTGLLINFNTAYLRDGIKRLSP